MNAASLEVYIVQSFLQGMTNNVVVFTFSVGDTTRTVYNEAVLRKTNRIDDTKYTFECISCKGPRAMLNEDRV